jgi:hypothetical protein
LAKISRKRRTFIRNKSAMEKEFGTDAASLRGFCDSESKS